jgi:hypothetical protein
MLLAIPGGATTAFSFDSRRRHTVERLDTDNPRSSPGYPGCGGRIRTTNLGTYEAPALPFGATPRREGYNDHHRVFTRKPMTFDPSLNTPQGVSMFDSGDKRTGRKRGLVHSPNSPEGMQDSNLRSRIRGNPSQPTSTCSLCKTTRRGDVLGAEPSCTVLSVPDASRPAVALSRRVLDKR